MYKLTIDGIIKTLTGDQLEIMLREVLYDIKERVVIFHQKKGYTEVDLDIVEEAGEHVINGILNYTDELTITHSIEGYLFTRIRNRISYKRQYGARIVEINDNQEIIHNDNYNETKSMCDFLNSNCYKLYISTIKNKIKNKINIEILTIILMGGKITDIIKANGDIDDERGRNNASQKKRRVKIHYLSWLYKKYNTSINNKYNTNEIDRNVKIIYDNNNIDNKEDNQMSKSFENWITKNC